MSQVLYRKYRSKKLSEIVGQEHITKTLNEALKSGRISHAYLFTGPRGVGKTSVARILAHEINGLEYVDDQPNIDIIEIDAASNRRIDEIRDLREKVHTLPSSAKYKVYIIDEVHMLTKEAFNALLKTLEEPPAHVIFILATTDQHKLPDTIISRTQRFSFKPIDDSHAVEHLKTIAASEKIKIDDQAIKLIAEHGEGSFRDSISLLDQLGHGTKTVTEDDVRSILGLPPAKAVDSLINLIDSPNTSYKQLADELKSCYDQGFSPTLLAKQLMNALRDRLVDGQLNLSQTRSLTLLKELLSVASSNDPASFLLVTLLGSLDSSTVQALAQPEAKSDTKAAAMAVKNPSKTEVFKKPKPKQTINDSTWPELLSELKKKHNTLYGIVKTAEPELKDNELSLTFDYAFHKKQVSEAKNKQFIADILHDITGQNFAIRVFLNDKDHRTLVNKDKPNQSTKELDAISKVFGGGELVDEQ